MTDKPESTLVTLANERRPPVRVKLERMTASHSKVLPPDGNKEIWWDRLKKALGTTSSDFVDGSLWQLQAAAKLPYTGISETAMNSALAMIEAAAPRDEIEGALAVQMACTHSAAVSVLARFSDGGGTERRIVAFTSAAAKLLRAYSLQVETFRRLRHGGDQYVRVEHVHVSDGGQAVIGNVRTRDNRDKGERRAKERLQRPRMDNINYEDDQHDHDLPLAGSASNSDLARGAGIDAIGRGGGDIPGTLDNEYTDEESDFEVDDTDDA
jgi:hypothetical protein